jgi:hypothetical protein
MNEICYWNFCFIPISTSPATKIFGFSEFLAAIALLAVVYTITDVRYKFRIAVTPGLLYVATFGLIATIGLQTLLTEVWIAEGWWVPKTVWITRTTWQGIFGLLFLGTFLTWMYYAFICPPIFCRRNAQRFAQELYGSILRGNDDELKVIANELARSARPLIRHSKLLANRPRNNEADSRMPAKKKGSVEDYAHDILLLIANRKLCQLIVAASPVTAQTFFEEMKAQSKFNIPIGPFARNISSEAVAQKGSFLYGEAAGYESGLLGYLKPVSQAVYGNHNLVEALAANGGSPLDISHEELWEWDAKQWEAYCRATLTTLEDFLANGHYSNNSHELNRAIDNIRQTFRDLYKLGDVPDYYESDIHNRLRVAADFVNKAIKLIDKQHSLLKPLPRVREDTYPKNIYDHLALFIFEMCFSASTVRSSPETCWGIHYGIVWSRVYKGYSDGAAWKIVRSKVNRLLYDEIEKLIEMPNYRGSRILGYCLNILGMKMGPSKQNCGREEYALAKVVQSWTRKHYLLMRQKNLDVAESVLIGRLSFDEAGSRLYITYSKGLNQEAPKTYMELEQPTTL